MSSEVCKDVHSKESLLSFPRLFSIFFVHLHFSEVARGRFFFLLACPHFLFSFDFLVLSSFSQCVPIFLQDKEKINGQTGEKLLNSYFTVQYSMNPVQAPFCPSTI